MVKHEHSLLPYRFGERDLNVLLRNWRRLGVGMEGRNCRQPSACLLVYDPSHPIPVSLPFIPGLDSDSLRKYRRMLCVTRLQILPSPVPSSCHPTIRIPLDLLFQRRSSPAPIEGWPGCSNLPPASRKPKLVGWLFLFSADYGRSLVAGIPSGDKFVRLSEPRAHPIQPCLNGYVLPPLSRGERSHDKFQRSR